VNKFASEYRMGLGRCVRPVPRTYVVTECKAAEGSAPVGSVPVHEPVGRVEAALLRVQQNGLELKKLPPKMRANEPIVLAAVRNNGMALQYAGKICKKNPLIVKEAYTQCRAALQFAASALLLDSNFMLACVHFDGLLLQFAMPDVKDEWRVVEAAVLNNCEALIYAGKKLQENEDLKRIVEKKSSRSKRVSKAHQVEI
jgi:Domain of unknown function (DUF4116)